MTTDARSRYFSFGEFRLDCRSGELRKSKREIRLQPQPAKLLVLLATRRGETVTRTEIQEALWGEDTFVDFEHGINFSIKQIRDALGDDAEKPRYIETVPRMGYRFIAQAGDVTNETEWVSQQEPSGSSRRRRRKTLAVVLGALATLTTLGALAVSILRPRAPSSNLRMPRFQISLPRGVSIPSINFNVLAFSPDGSKFAFVGCDDSYPSRVHWSGCQLYLRDQSSLDAKALPGTGDAQSPFFSPDGRWLAFASRGKLKKISLDDGTVVTLADSTVGRGGTWAEDQTILFSQGGGGILRVSDKGGEVQEFTTLDVERHEYDHRWPQILPGGRAVLIEVVREQGTLYAGSRGHDIAVVDLTTGTKRTLIESGGTPKYADGHLVFGRDGVLYAAPIDSERFELTGMAAPVLEGVFMWSSPGENSSSAGNVNYDVSPGGALLFSPREARPPKRTLVLLDRDGGQIPISSAPLSYSDPQFSPDGRRVAAAVEEDVGSWSASVIDTASGAMTRVASDSVPSAWTAQGELILSGGGLRLATVDGSAPPKTLYAGDAGYMSVGPDGKVLFSTQAAPGRWDIWEVSLRLGRDAGPWLATSSWEQAPSLSPDGGWVAYHSDESSSGSFEIYVRAIGGGARHQLSHHGGLYPRWSRDGREIFFAGKGSLWSAPVRTSPTFGSDPPRELFELPHEIRVGVSQFYDVSGWSALRDGPARPVRAAPARPRRRSELGRGDGSAPRRGEVNPSKSTVLRQRSHP